MGRRLVTALTAAVLAATAGCGSDVEGSFEPLGQAVRKSASTGEPVRLASVTDFKWDRVYAFPPYSTRARVSEELGFEWNGVEGSKSESTDGYGLLVFVRDAEVARAFDQSVGDGDLTCLQSSTVRGGLTPKEAVLHVSTTRSADGRAYHYVSLARPRGTAEKLRIHRCLRRYL
jgi:hypothetical protein